MSSSRRLTETPPQVKLCTLETIPDGTARNFVLEISDERFYGFVIRKGAEVFGYVDSCPHQGVTLAKKLDDYLTPKADFIACSWHGALFQVNDGLCVGGPCSGQSLHAWPVQVKDGFIYTA